MRKRTDPTVLQFRGVEKQYGPRPLRLHELCVAAGTRVTLLGLHPAEAEVFVNLTTGATLPDAGTVMVFGRPTDTIVDSNDWLAFVERFGIVSDRIVFLEGMTAAQNLAIPFTLMLDPLVPPVYHHVRGMAEEAGLSEAALKTRMADLDALGRARVRLARALALDPAILLLEHPTRSLPTDEIPLYAVDLLRLAGRREVAMVTLTDDEQFARTLGGRLLSWSPASGVVESAGRWRRALMARLS